MRATTAVVNPPKKKKKKRNPATAYGAAATPNKKRKKGRRKGRRNPGSAISPYSSGGYYRRPNARKNPSALDMDTWTRVLPAGVAGIWACRWAVSMAGPFEPDAQGVPVPGFKHFVAGVLAVEVGGKIIGDMLGAQREIDVAQIAGISYMGDLFLRTRVLRDNEWVLKNISLEGVGQMTAEQARSACASPRAANNQLGADTFTDAAGNRYMRSGGGWALANWQYSAAAGMGQPQPIEIPANAQPGDIIRTTSGQLYQLMGNGQLQGLTDSETARALGSFYESTPLGSAGGGSRRSSGSSFGYSVAQ